jgi:hypothetical protein
MTGLLFILVLLGLLGRVLWGWRGGRDGDLAGLLASAETAGILTAEQRTRLLAHAAARRPPAGTSGTVWLAVFAGLFVVAGFALLVAHNWASIGPAARVVAFLAFLTIVGEAALRVRAAAAGVALELVWFVLPLVGIGLYGQTFHLAGDPILPFLTWLALTAPLAWLSRGVFVPLGHTLALIGVLFAGNFGTAGVLALHTGPGAMVGAAAPLAWALSIVLLALIAAQSLRRLPRDHRHHFVGVTAVWTFMLLVAPTPLRVQHEGWLAVTAAALATVWLVALARLPASAAERGAAAAAWLATLYAMSFAWHGTRPWDGAVSTGGLVVAGIAVVGALAGAALLPRDRAAGGAAIGRSAAARALVAAPVLIALLLPTESPLLVRIAAVACNLLLLIIAIALMWRGSLERRIDHINLGIAVLLVVLVTRFLDVFGSFIQSGVGLIGAGMLLAGLAYALQRTRQRLLHRPAEDAR